jgi:GTP cyclohydrolase FolE2
MLAELKEYLPDEGQIENLLRVAESQPAIQILKVAKREHERCLTKANQEGRICDEDFRRDIRYLLGRASMAEDILALPKLAETWLHRQKE